MAKPISKSKSRRSSTWQLQTAKAKFSELFRRAHQEGPQYVTRQGQEAVVVVPAQQFERLVARARQPKGLLEFFAHSPLAKVRIGLERKADFGRDVEL